MLGAIFTNLWLHSTDLYSKVTKLGFWSRKMRNIPRAMKEHFSDFWEMVDFVNIILRKFTTISLKFIEKLSFAQIFFATRSKYVSLVLREWKKISLKKMWTFFRAIFFLESPETQVWNVLKKVSIKTAAEKISPTGYRVPIGGYRFGIEFAKICVFDDSLKLKWKFFCRPPPLQTDLF